MDDFWVLLTNLKNYKKKLDQNRYDLNIAKIQQLEERIDIINDELSIYFMKDRSYRLEYLKFTRGMK